MLRPIYSDTHYNPHRGGRGSLSLVEIWLGDVPYDPKRTQGITLAVELAVGFPPNDLGCDRGLSVYVDTHQERVSSGRNRRPRPRLGGLYVGGSQLTNAVSVLQPWLAFAAVIVQAADEKTALPRISPRGLGLGRDANRRQIRVIVPYSRTI
jgi:hypothetical protein